MVLYKFRIIIIIIIMLTETAFETRKRELVDLAEVVV